MNMPIIQVGALPNQNNIPQFFIEEKIIENPFICLGEKDNLGSVIIQNIYEKSSIDIRNKIFDKIKSEINNMAIHEFHNYFLIKIMTQTKLILYIVH